MDSMATFMYHRCHIIKLTRGILEVMLEARQPVTLITKNSLLVRDIDILAPMAERNLVAAALSITTLDAELARTMEPRTATPQAKLRAIRLANEAAVQADDQAAKAIADEAAAAKTAAKKPRAVKAVTKTPRAAASKTPRTAATKTATAKSKSPKG